MKYLTLAVMAMVTFIGSATCFQQPWRTSSGMLTYDIDEIVEAIPPKPMPQWMLQLADSEEYKNFIAPWFEPLLRFLSNQTILWHFIMAEAQLV